MTCLRLILGDQLDSGHSWFRNSDSEVVYVVMEVRQETDYVWHHAQKVIAFFASMRAFAAELEVKGHRVAYLAIDDPKNRQSVPDNLSDLARTYGATRIEFQEPDEHRLDQQLQDYRTRAPVTTVRVPSEHFYTERLEAGALFDAQPHWLLERFYRHLRIEHRVLIDAKNKPIGGRWNFDAANRKAWRGTPPEPPDARPSHNHAALWKTIRNAGVHTFGNPQAEAFRWPLNRAEALQQLAHFIEHALPSFGDFQDAMSATATRLFHSQISFALNTKMLNPREVVARAIQAYETGQAPLNTVEGYVRQVLGWREYVRGVYWAKGPRYLLSNHFAHRRRLPSWFWSGATRMRCMAASIGQSLEHAHAHHIQRLMVIGNFSLLAGIDPLHVHHWYLGIYIDAIEWVEVPNTLGLSQFADGGLLATKPYVSSAAYIDRMSDYCKGCYYDKSLRTGPRSCPFNSLYWAFLIRKKDKLSSSPRMALPYKNLSTWSKQDVDAVLQRAEDVLANLEAI